MEQNSDTCFIERRRFPRCPCAGEVEILQRERCWGWGRANEISRGGCYIETIHPLPIGTEVELRLAVADTQLDICARVVSATPLVGMGMAFVVESPQQWTKLVQLEERIKSNDIFNTEPACVNPGEGLLPMRAALQLLQQAQQKLQEALHDKEELCAKALQLTESAINEVNNGIQAVKRHPETIDSEAMGNGVALRDKLFNEWLMTGL